MEDTANGRIGDRAPHRVLKMFVECTQGCKPDDVRVVEREYGVCVRLARPSVLMMSLGRVSGWATWSICVGSCTNPAPSPGGSGCGGLGPSSQSRRCNEDPCVPQPMQCPGSHTDAVTGVTVECSGHGTCMRSPPKCGRLDAGCVACCHCHANFTGEACTIPVSSLPQRQSLRAQLLNATMTTIAGMDVTSESVQMAATSLRRCVGDGYEVGTPRLHVDEIYTFSLTSPVCMASSANRQHYSDGA